LQRITLYLAQRDVLAARLVRDRLDAAGAALGTHSIGRPGRFKGTFEKSVPRTPYILQYRLRSFADREFIVILAVVHARRNWRKGEAPPDP